jgi:hypothetical protein
VAAGFLFAHQSWKLAGISKDEANTKAINYVSPIDVVEWDQVLNPWLNKYLRS